MKRVNDKLLGLQHQVPICQLFFSQVEANQSLWDLVQTHFLMLHDQVVVTVVLLCLFRVYQAMEVLSKHSKNVSVDRKI